MRVIVTGGAGFVGTMLARRLLAGPVEVGGGEPADVDELVLADLVAPAPDVAADPRVRAVMVDLATEAGERFLESRLAIGSDAECRMVARQLK